MTIPTDAPVNWGQIMVVLFLAIIGNVALSAFLFAAIFDKLVVSAFKRCENDIITIINKLYVSEPAVFDRMVIGAMERLDGQLKQIIDRIYVDRIVKVDLSMSTVEHNRARIDSVEAAAQRQAETILDGMKESQLATTRAFEKLTSALEAIAKEAQKTAVDVAVIRGSLKNDSSDDNEDRAERRWQEANRRHLLPGRRRDDGDQLSLDDPEPT